MTSKNQTCAGWPEAGNCDRPAGHPREPGLPESEIWCRECDAARIEHISAQLEAMLGAIGDSEEG